MKIWIVALNVIFWVQFQPVYSQTLPSYWQQEVNYTIRVKLDDVAHFLHGEISIEYQNNSPSTLTSLYFHLYPNAYRDNFTVFAKQQAENGSTEFYYAEDSMRGYIDSLSFRANGINTVVTYDSIHPDIAQVFLPVPLTAGKKVIITTPFRVKIPYTFSRLGHVGQQYQISQWYPKPAVFDHTGWHQMPYLDQGEFYSDFGSFDVRITLPENYVVGSTGVLQTQKEIEWLNEKATWSELNRDRPQVPDDKNTPSSSENKTLHYKAANVHDFAWFADKRYQITRSSIRLPSSKRTVNTWALFLPGSSFLWKDASNFADSALWYYSRWLGDYPYDQATVVEGALSKTAGGMEYPMITVIGSSDNSKMLDRVIAHELGHNWLYGALGFNEREHAWMDEGINSYYENRYMAARYPNDSLMPESLESFQRIFDLNYPSSYENYLFYLLSAAQRNDQPADLRADSFTILNYGAVIYAKVSLLMAYLESSLGRENFDAIMQSFYREWVFKHPAADDLRIHFEQQSKRELDWFFRQLIPTIDYLDYKLVKEDVGIAIGNTSYAQIVVRNKGQVKGPYSIAAYRDEKKIAQLDYGGFEGTMTVLFPEGEYDYFKLDPDFVIPELNRKNNTLKRQGILRTTERLRLQWFASIDNPDRTQLFFQPLSGYNHYDGLMPGIAFYNSVLFPKKINVVLVPQFGTRSSEPVGLASVSIPFYISNSLLQRITLTSTAKSYTYESGELYGDTIDQDLRYARFMQEMAFQLRKKNPRSRVTEKIIYRNTIANFQRIIPSDVRPDLRYEHQMFNSLSYHFSNNTVINPFQLRLKTEFGSAEFMSADLDDFIKVMGEGIFTVSYPKKKTGLEIRFFGGLFVKPPLSDVYKFRLSATTGLDDYRFDEIFLGRSEKEGILAQQIAIADDGGFKMRTNGVFPRLGESDSWIMALNLKIPAPFFTPVFVFADGGMTPKDKDPTFATYDVFQYDAGIGFTLIPKIAEVYLPLFYSDDIKTNLTTTDFYDQWYQRITFVLNINRLNPFDMIRNFQL